MSTTEPSSSRRPQLGAAHTDQSEYAGDVLNLSLIQRRQSRLGASILFYHDPVHIVRGEGVFLYDDTGQKYLDCYNNVASVGHCHPRVVSALSEQAARLNTHTRYLHEGVIDYADAIAEKMPGDLGLCMFVCTGTEANELAMRIARTVTGKTGLIVTDNSYHGNSTLMTEASTALYDPADRPNYIATVEPPDTYRGRYREGETEDPCAAYAGQVDEAIQILKKRRKGVAAFLCDTIFDMQGTLEAPKGYFASVYEKIRAAGGLCIADEVQAGLCRTGKWWGFEHYDIVPDIVTLGKPMGDGHPIGIVVTTEAIAREFAKSAIYFNTFGGNPVSMAVGRSVLSVCDDERLVENCRDTGAYLRERLESLAQRHEIIGNVRGHGLFQGIELVKDRETLEPAADLAAQIPDLMKREGVLIGMSGRHGNVLKIRPPLVFSKDDADQLVETLDRVLVNL